MGKFTRELYYSHFSTFGPVQSVISGVQTEQAQKIGRALKLIDHGARVLSYLGKKHLPFDIDIRGLSIDKRGEPDVESFVIAVKMEVISLLSGAIFYSNDTVKDIYSLFLGRFAFQNAKEAEKYSHLPTISGRSSVFAVVNGELRKAAIPQTVRETYTGSKKWYLEYHPEKVISTHTVTPSIFSFPTLLIATIFDYLSSREGQEVKLSEMRGDLIQRGFSRAAINLALLERVSQCIIKRGYSLQILGKNLIKLTRNGEQEEGKKDPKIGASIFSVSQAQFTDISEGLPPYFDTEKYTLYDVTLEQDEFILCCIVFKRKSVKISQVKLYLQQGISADDMRVLVNSINEKMRHTEFSVSQRDGFSYAQREQSSFKDL